MRRRSILFLAILGLALPLLAADCDGGGGGGGGGTTTSSTVTTSPPTTQPPANDDSRGGQIDLSQPAADRFTAIWRYETVVQSDLNQGAQHAYDAGRQACEAIIDRTALTSTVEDVKTRFGFTGSGAQAVVAAALRTLCPNYNTGYRTHFDRAVADAQDRITREWGSRPTEMSTGEAVKLICGHLNSRQTAEGLTDLLHSEGTPKDASGNSAPIKLTVRAAVAAYCFNFDLPPYWQGPG